MKIFKTIFLAFFLILINVSGFCAKTPPAPPTARAAKLPPNPPDSPIDQNLMLLLVIALVFGAYTIYTYNQKRKASI